MVAYSKLSGPQGPLVLPSPHATSIWLKLQTSATIPTFTWMLSIETQAQAFTLNPEHILATELSA